MQLETVIPAYRPDSRLLDIISRLKSQTVCPDRIRIILTTDSAEEAGRLRSVLPDDIVLETVGTDEFSHGTTRLKAALSSPASYVLFMTQDALPLGNDLTAQLISSFKAPFTAVAYARQVPYQGASETEAFARRFNYPPDSSVKTKEDLERIGIRAAFCSDTCAMYDMSVFRKLGGFELGLDFNEDLFYAYRALIAGYSISYNADAKVYHSHNLSLAGLFRRYRQNAIAQRLHPEIFSRYPSEKAGKSFVKEGLDYFFSHKRYLTAFRFLIESAVKYLGFLSGRIARFRG